MPETALQELLVNALIHRDYFTSASIRILVFADRIEIVSPGNLPDNLSVDAIRQGRTNRRNPTLTEHALHLLPYRGLGSGIPRAFKAWPHIALIDDAGGNQFSAIIQRPRSEQARPPQVTPQVTPQVMTVLRAIADSAWSRRELMGKLRLKDRNNFDKLYLAPALETGLVARTIPQKPSSRLQKYHLTELGKRLLASHSEKGRV